MRSKVKIIKIDLQSMPFLLSCKFHFVNKLIVGVNFSPLSPPAVLEGLLDMSLNVQNFPFMKTFVGQVKMRGGVKLTPTVK